MTHRNDSPAAAPSRYAVPALVVLSLALAGTGCSPYDATVTGVVTLNGQPLDHGTVSFVPSASGSPAYSLIDADGSYRLKTGREYGLPTGDYKATVVANAPTDPSKVKPGVPPPPGQPITPAWYRTTSDTSLSFTIQKGKNTIDLPLSLDPPANWTDKRKRRK